MSDKHQNTDGEFVQAVRSALDAQAEHLDAKTLGQLRAARRQALAQLEARAPHRAAWTSWWVPAGTFATAGIAAVVFSLWSGHAPQPPGIDAADVEMLAETDSLELYDDLEFYEWLDLTS